MHLNILTMERKLTHFVGLSPQHWEVCVPCLYPASIAFWRNHGIAPLQSLLFFFFFLHPLNKPLLAGKKTKKVALSEMLHSFLSNTQWRNIKSRAPIVCKKKDFDQINLCHLRLSHVKKKRLFLCLNTEIRSPKYPLNNYFSYLVIQPRRIKSGYKTCCRL